MANIMKNLDSNKSYGHGNISIRMLKYATFQSERLWKSFLELTQIIVTLFKIKTTSNVYYQEYWRAKLSNILGIIDMYPCYQFLARYLKELYIILTI